MTYLITFACYGNYLPGAEGWVDRLRGNCQRGGTQAPYSPLEAHARAALRQAPKLSANQTPN